MGNKKGNCGVLEQPIFVNDVPEFKEGRGGEYGILKGANTEKAGNEKYPKTYRISLKVTIFNDKVDEVKQLNIQKGDLVLVRGRLNCSVWKDDEDVWHEMKELLLWDIEMIKRKGVSRNDTRNSEPKPVMEIPDSEIPF